MNDSDPADEHEMNGPGRDGEFDSARRAPASWATDAVGVDGTILRLSSALDEAPAEMLDDLALYADVITTAWTTLEGDVREHLAEVFRDRLARIAAGEDIVDSRGCPLPVTAELTRHVAWMADGLGDRAVADRLAHLASGRGRLRRRTKHGQPGLVAR